MLELTTQERDVLECLCSEYTNAEIVEETNLGPDCVRLMKQVLKTKFDVTTLDDLMVVGRVYLRKKNG